MTEIKSWEHAKSAGFRDSFLSSSEPLIIGFLALPAGIAFLGFSMIIWKIGVRHYKSHKSREVDIPNSPCF